MKGHVTQDIIPFTDDFIFSLVMRDINICRGLLERILPEEEFSDIKLASSDHPLFSDKMISAEDLSVETQKNLKFTTDSHGVRFDAYIKSKDAWAEIEMQTYKEEHIGKRSRYYRSMMDLDDLIAGKPYKNLKTSYVIFICTYDYIGMDEPVYYFQSYDVKNQLCLDDDTYIIILNSKCSPEKVPEKLRTLYNYLNDPQKAEKDALTEQIDESVKKYNSPEWRQKHMTLDYLINRARDEGQEAGAAIERERMNQLIQLLLQADRAEDLARASQDAEYQDALFKEFGLL